MIDERDYIHPTVTVDPVELANAANDAIAEQVPGWSPLPYALEQRLLAAFAGEAATGLQLLTTVPTAIITEFGNLARIHQETALPATGTVTVHAIDDDGHVLSAGATLQGVAPDGSVIPLELIEDAIIPGSSTSVSGVQVQATIDGEIGNGITGDVQPDDALVWLDQITLDAPTARGVDEEDPDEFLDRLNRRLGLLADAQIYPENIQALVQDVPGVGRCTVLNLIDPDAPSVDTAGHITIAITDPSGVAVGGGVQADVEALVERARVLNHVMHVVGPTANPLTVAITVAAWPEAMATAGDATKAEILSWLSPLTWGMPQWDGDGDDWRQTRHVRIAELVAVAARAPGVAYVDLDSARINAAAVDVEMTGLVPLPSIGPEDITVTVIERVP
ncbi:MAG: baseplate J/gp47 family protein [Solirubrobacteraceae bacterium]|nr:baseplate J/gp47 family protein [Solirubrobacteraceae bacterium]